MRVLIDACVLFPSVPRAILMRLAATGFFTPLYSDKIIEEWEHAAARNGVAAEAATEIAVFRSQFAGGCVPEAAPRLDLSLPDADDLHVLQSAIDGQAGELLTFNAKDFPPKALARFGILRRAPDEFLLEAFHADEVLMRDILADVARVAATRDGADVPVAKLLKKARLPRLGKVVGLDA